MALKQQNNSNTGRVVRQSVRVSQALAKVFSGVAFNAIALTALSGGVLFSGIAQAAEQKTLLVYAPTTESTTTNELANYGSKLEVITRSQIEQAGVNADITRVLQMYVPGFYVAPKAGPFDYGAYSLLGGKADDTLILIDGVRLNNRLYGGIYIDTLPVTAIERIEVLKGAQSLMFGTQAVTGVVNIVTRTPRDKKLTGEVNLAVDSFGGTDTDASVSNVHDNRVGHFSWMLWANKNRSSGYKPFRDQDISDLVTQRKRAYDLNIAGLKLSQTFGDSARLSVLWQYANGKFDFASANRFTNTDRNDRVQNIGTVTFDHYINDNFSYFIKGHINRWDTRYTKILNTASGNLDVVNNKDYWGFRDYGLQLEGKFTTENKGDLVFGMDNQWYSGQDQVLKIAKNTATANAFYLQLRPQFSFLPDWYPAIGLRHEKIHGGNGATVWMISSRYEISRDFQLRGQIGTAYKLPTAELLYAMEPDEIGNPNLKPEKSRNIEVGFDYRPGWLDNKLNLSASYYHRHIYDMQSLDNNSFTFINVPGKVNVQGFEANGTITLNPQWTISADITRNYLNSQYVITNVPYLFSRARLDYQSENKRFGGQLAVRYINKIIARNTDYGHYAVVDASVWLHLDKGLHHRIMLSVDNLLNRQYASALTTNDRRQVIGLYGRPFTAQLRYSWLF